MFNVTTEDVIRQAVMEVPGVLACSSVYQARQMTLRIVVTGGDPGAIGGRLADVVPYGVLTVGSTEVHNVRHGVGRCMRFDYRYPPT